MASNKPQMGEWRTVTGYANKKKYSTTNRAYPQKTTWHRMVTPPKRMMFIGTRTVYDGVADWHGSYEEEHLHFTQQQSHKIYVFVENERSNPIYVFPEDVEDADER